MAPNASPARPNIVLFVADDLGYGELGCYGQKKIKTPNIDRLAARGVRFTQAYSGNPVCAPSRCTLMTGLHTGHCYVRGNKPIDPRRIKEGQIPIPGATVTLAERLKELGYVNFGVGKWGLGGPGSVGRPLNQGFDHFFGYLGQYHAHNHYTDHLYRDGQRVQLKNPKFKAHQRLKTAPKNEAGYARYSGQDYAPDLMADEALKHMDRYKDRPFFLYYATTVPHVALQVPEDSLAAYRKLGWDKSPYLGQKAYLPHPAPRAAYAAMVSRMDRDVGRVMGKLKEHGLAENTIFIFTSDNGPTFNGGSDSKFFNSAGPLRGLKGSVFEGGIRVPLIVRWPKVAPAGVTSDHVCAFWDFLPTLLEAAGGDAPKDIDGLSFINALRPSRTPGKHTHLYWELGLQQALRVGGWKLIRLWSRRANKPRVLLFNLKDDIGESRNLAAAEPALVRAMLKEMQAVRRPSAEFPAKYDR